MPSDLRLTQDIIIEILVFCDFSLQRDIFAHIKSAAVEQQCGQQAAHSAVSIIEGMNAEKVVDEHRNDDQRLHFHVPNDPVVLLANPVQGLRRFIGGQWRKQGLHMAVGIGGADVVLHAFGPARHGIVHVAVEDLVELQDVVLGDGDGVEVLVNEVQHVPVTSDLLFIPVSRHRFLLHKLSDTGVCGHDALNGIGCLGALHLCDLYQFLQFLWPLFQVQFLLSGFFIDRRNQAQNLRVPLLLPDRRVVECTHTLILPSFP